MNLGSGEPLDIFRAKYRFITADVLGFASKFSELAKETTRYFLSIRADPIVTLAEVALRSPARASLSR